MVETLRVTVAPGECVVIAPHPSGIAALGSLHLYGGEVLTVIAAEADRLHRSGKILHPVTGKAMPQPAQVTGPTISVNGSRPMPLSDPSANMILGRAIGELSDAHEAARPPRFNQIPSDKQPLPVTVWREDGPWHSD